MNGGPLSSRIRSEYRLWEVLALLPVWLLAVPVLLLFAAVYGIWVALPGGLLALLTWRVLTAPRTVSIRFDGVSFLVRVGVKTYSFAVSEINEIRIASTSELECNPVSSVGPTVDHRVNPKAKTLVLDAADGARYAFSVTDEFADRIESQPRAN